MEKQQNYSTVLTLYNGLCGQVTDFEKKRYRYNFHHLLDCTMLLYRLTQNLKTNNTLFTSHIIKIPIGLFVTSVHICKGSENC